MRPIHVHTEDESRESQMKSRRHNPALVAAVEHNGETVRVVLGVGRADDVYFYLEGSELIVLSINSRMPYVSFQVYALDDGGGESVGTFLQGDEQVTDGLGEDWEDKPALEIAQQLYRQHNEH